MDSVAEDSYIDNGNIDEDIVPLDIGKKLDDCSIIMDTDDDGSISKDIGNIDEDIVSESSEDIGNIDEAIDPLELCTSGKP